MAAHQESGLTEPQSSNDSLPETLLASKEPRQPPTDGQQVQNGCDVQGDGQVPITAPNDDTEQTYPGSKQVAILGMALFLAVFLAALDRTIISTAIPSITDEFHSVDDIGWYGSVFLLTCCCSQLLSGRLYTLYPHKHIFLASIVLFEVGSAVCGAAPNSVAFICGRAIAGAASAGLQAGGSVIIADAMPPHKRPAFQGIVGASFGVASAVGPLIGGAFTTDVSWRWCFYINLPLGAAVILIIAVFLRPNEAQKKDLTFRQQLAQLDLMGEFFLFPSMICLILGLEWGGTTYAWSDWRVIVLLLFFGLLLIGFILSQILRPEAATISVRVAKNRALIAISLFAFFLFSTSMLVVYYLPLWFQAIQGVSAVESGIRLLPLVLSLTTGSIVAGILTSKVGYNAPFVYIAVVGTSIGAGLFTTLRLGTSEGRWIGFQILFGLTMGMGMMQGMITVQTTLPRQDIPTGIALVLLMQTLGGAIFLSVGENVLLTNLVKRLGRLAGGLDADTIVNTGATDLRSIVPQAQLSAVLGAYNSSIRQVFIVAVITACLSAMGAALMPWKRIPRKPKAHGSKSTEENTGEKAGVA